MSAFGARSQRLVAAAFRIRELGVIVAIIAACAFFASRAPQFMTVDNWRDIGVEVAIVVIAGIGQMAVVLTRNIDLSQGSIIGLTAFVTGSTLRGHPDAAMVVVLLLSIGIGVACGLINGVLVAVLRIPAIVATLATLSIFRGIDILYADARDVVASDLPDRFLNLAYTMFLGVPLILWVAIVVAVVSSGVFRWAPWARDWYAIGSNPDAARFTGIPITRRLIGAFVLSGALAGLSGFLFAARFAGVNAVAATGFEFIIIAAIVIGGVNVFGGVGTVPGAVAGAVLVGVVESGFTILQISEFWKMVFQGTAIVVAIAIDALISNRLQEMLRRRRRIEARAARLGVST